MIDAERLKEDLKRDEGETKFPYYDAVGKITIGVGRNLTDRGLSEAEVRALLDNDVWIVFRELDRAIEGWRSYPEPVARGLANMAFNLGIPRLMKFEKMLAALARGDYTGAADEALNSIWARQVRERASRIATLFRSVTEEQ